MATTNEAKTNMQNPTSASEVMAHLNGKASTHTTSVLGQLIWWSLHNVEILQADLEKIVEQEQPRDPITGHVIQPKEVCPRLLARGGLMKALRELNIKPGSSRSRTKKKNENGNAKAVPGLEGKVLMARRLDSRDNPSLGTGFAVVLVEETVTSTASGPDLDWQEVQRISYSPETRKLSFTTGLLEQEIRDGFRKYAETYRATEVTRMIGQLIERGHGIVARESGGVYFLPKQTMAIGESLERILSQVPGASLTPWPVLDTEGTTGHKAQTLEIAGKAIKKELKELRKEMKEMRNRTLDPDGQLVLGATLNNRIDAFKALKLKARTYRDLLGLADQQIRNELNALTREAKQLIHGNEVKKQQRKVEA